MLPTALCRLASPLKHPRARTCDGLTGGLDLGRGSEERPAGTDREEDRGATLATHGTSAGRDTFR